MSKKINLNSPSKKNTLKGGILNEKSTIIRTGTVSGSGSLECFRSPLSDIAGDSRMPLTC